MMKFGAKIITGTLLILLLTPLCFAQKTTPAPIIPGDVSRTDIELVLPQNPEGENEGMYLGKNFLPLLTQTIIALAGGMAFLFIIIGGIQILTAYGNDEKIGNAKKTITYAIVGLLIAILSYAIVSIISGIQIGPQSQQGQPGAGSGQSNSDVPPDEPGRYENGALTKDEILEGAKSKE